MKKISLIILLFILTASQSFSQSSKEQDFTNTVKEVVSALSKRDSVRLSKYINKKTGVYILYRIGVRDSYSNYTTLGFSDSTYPNMPFYDDVKLTRLQYAKLPAYDCEKWSKTGTFVDTTRTDHFFYNAAKKQTEYADDKIPDAEIKKFYALESISRRVVIAAAEGNELIFYLSYMNGKWWLTIIDKLTCDCSV